VDVADEDKHGAHAQNVASGAQTAVGYGTEANVRQGGCCEDAFEALWLTAQLCMQKGDNVCMRHEKPARARAGYARYTHWTAIQCAAEIGHQRVGGWRYENKEDNGKRIKPKNQTQQKNMIKKKREESEGVGVAKGKWEGVKRTGMLRNSRINVASRNQITTSMM
jgi:hypothetical protein